MTYDVSLPQSAHKNGTAVAARTIFSSGLTFKN